MSNEMTPNDDDFMPESWEPSKLERIAAANTLKRQELHFQSAETLLYLAEAELDTIDREQVQIDHDSVEFEIAVQQVANIQQMINLLKPDMTQQEADEWAERLKSALAQLEEANIVAAQQGTVDTDYILQLYHVTLP